VAEVTVSETLVETVPLVVVVVEVETVPLEVVDLLGGNSLTKMVLVGDPIIGLSQFRKLPTGEHNNTVKCTLDGRTTSVFLPVLV